ncbi:MAG: hypothetical protein WBG32_18410 [Nodosilinea sp.]
MLIARLPQAPSAIVDIGCGVGMSTEAFQTMFPMAFHELPQRRP